MKNEKDIFKYISKPTYDSHNLFDKNIVGIHENKIYLTLSKPIYVECTVLEISKLAMYDFQSNFMKKFYCLLTMIICVMKIMKIFMKNFMSKLKIVNIFPMIIKKYSVK